MQGSIAFDGTLSGSIAGGGGGGSEVTITPTLTSGTKIADYEIDSTPGELYAPTPESLTAAAPLDITSGVISIDLSGYQEKLTAGSYITIDSDNEISCSPPISVVWYTPEPDVQQDVLIGKFRVNDVIQNVYAPAGGSSWDYSTSEVDTGQKWIDGKTIYCKVINQSAGAGETVITINGADNILPTTCYKVSDGNNEYALMNSYYNNNNDYVRVYIYNNEIHLNLGSATAVYYNNAKIIAFYTKS